MGRNGGEARDWARAARVVWLALGLSLGLGLGLGGCTPSGKVIWLELADFGQGAFDGVWLWRWSDAAQTYERDCRVSLGDVAVDGAGEFVVYSQQCPDAAARLPMRGKLERYASDPDTVRIRIRYVQRQPGSLYRITAYGAQGETALSDTTLQL